MIQEISIKIKSGGLTHTIQLDTDIDSNLPYDLAEAFIEVIRMTNANPDRVVEQLINEYGLSKNVNNNSSCEADFKNFMPRKGFKCEYYINQLYKK